MTSDESAVGRGGEASGGTSDEARVDSGDGLSSLKQDRSRRTRAKLVKTAAGLWREQGFDDTSVDEVCEAAGVAKGTFYFYFRAKEDLLIELGFGAAEGMIKEARRAMRADLTTVEVLDRAILGLADAASETAKPLLERTIEEIFHAIGKRWIEARTNRPHFREILNEIFTRGRSRGEVARHVPEEVAGIMALVLLQCLLDWSRDDTGDRALVNLLRRRARIVLQDVVLES